MLKKLKFTRAHNDNKDIYIIITFLEKNASQSMKWTIL